MYGHDSISGTLFAQHEFCQGRHLLGDGHLPFDFRSALTTWIRHYQGKFGGFFDRLAEPIKSRLLTPAVRIFVSDVCDQRHIYKISITGVYSITVFLL